MIKILYYSNCEKIGRRTFSLLKDYDGFDQTICSFNSGSIDVLKNQCIKIKSEEELVGLLKKNKTDVLVVLDRFPKIDKVKKLGIKTVFVANGEIVKGKFLGDCWNKFDLICLGRKQTEGLFGPKVKKIATNTLLQYDVLFNAIGSNNTVLTKKTITLFGPRIRGSSFRTPYAKLFYESVRIAIEVCDKFGWNLIIRPKHKNYDNMFHKLCPKINFCRLDGLGAKSNICVVDDDSVPYQWFLSDLLISVNPRSTVEIESALLRKPMIKVYSDYLLAKMFEEHDVYGTHSFNAAYFVDDIQSNLGNIMEKAMNSENKDLANNQKEFVKYLGISFDGRAQERMLNAIKEIV